MDEHYENAQRCNRPMLGCDELDLDDRAEVASVMAFLCAALESDAAAVVASTARLIDVMETDPDPAIDRVWALCEEIAQGAAVGMATGYRILAAVGRPDIEDAIDKVLSSDIEHVL